MLFFSNMHIEITKSKLKVLSSIASNFFVVWIVASFATTNLFILTRNILAAIIALYIAFKAEEFLEYYD